MKNKLLIGTIVFFIASTSQAYAVSPTPAPTVSGTSLKLDKQINQLKDKIASRVSQLNLVEKRGIIGTVQLVKDNQITLIGSDGTTKYVDVDEITKFSSVTSRGTFGLTDLTKGTQISILGLYNKESKRILARFIRTHTEPTRYSGTTATIDAKTFTLTIMTNEQKEVKINIDTTSRVLSYAKDADLVKYGFSKLAVGDRVEVIGYPDKKDPTMINADRLIDFINIAKNPSIVIATPTAGVTIAPTSAGSKKIDPIR